MNSRKTFCQTSIDVLKKHWWSRKCRECILKAMMWGRPGNEATILDELRTPLLRPPLWVGTAAQTLLAAVVIRHLAACLAPRDAGVAVLSPLLLQSWPF